MMDALAELTVEANLLAQERDIALGERNEAYRTINRIWAALGITGYAGGKEISQIVADQRKALSLALVSMKLASTIPEVSAEYEFGPAIERATAALAVAKAQP